jgi:hypothetical protein
MKKRVIWIGDSVISSTLKLPVDLLFIFGQVANVKKTT